MNDVPPPAPFSWLRDFGRLLPRLTALAAGLGVIYAALSWGIGSVRPQSQIDIADLKSEYADLKAQVAVHQERLDALPRAQDFADWKEHLHALDGRADAIDRELHQDEIDFAKVQTQVQGLTTIPAAPARGRGK